MKQTKVKLIKEMRQESEKFRVWKLKREQELTKLKNQDQKKQQKIVKMEALHSLKTKVWKQKEAETNAKLKRLEGILSKRTDVQKQKSKERMENFESFVSASLGQIVAYPYYLPVDRSVKIGIRRVAQPHETDPVDLG